MDYDVTFLSKYVEDTCAWCKTILFVDKPYSKKSYANKCT